MISATWHGHGCYLFDFSGTKVVIDPFLSDSPTADIGPDEVEADFILLTHGHGDHVGDTEAIARRTGAVIVAPNELAVYFGAKGLENHPMHIGGGWDFPFGRVQLTIAHHGSALIGEDGIPIYLGNPCGFLIKSESDWADWRRRIESGQGKSIIHVADHEPNLYSSEGRDGAVDEVEILSDEDDVDDMTTT